jgi:Kef-type K+ transport system membrane component KefB
VGSIGVCYFLIRIIGKYLGAYLSCFALKMNANIRNYIGLALIPQAGVAIGLAFLGQRLLPEETGNLLLTIILSSSVLYEMVGPISAKAALFLSGSIPRETIREGSADPELPAADDADTLSYESVPEEAEASDASDAAPASDPPEISETSEAYSAAFPKLKEYNEGVDERDDDDIEAVPALPKNRKKKKRKGKK